MSVVTKGSLANRILSIVLALSLCFMGIQANAIQQAWADAADAAEQAALTSDQQAIPADNGEVVQTNDQQATAAGNGEAVLADDQQVDPAGNGATASAADDEVINESVVANIAANKDSSGQAIVEAKTGESLGTTFFAYNDNPNAAATAKLRLFVDQTTIENNKTAIEPEGLDPDNLGESVILCELSQGGTATKVEAKWNLLAADDPDNTRSRDIYYLEFVLPSGSSVSLDMNIGTTTGYDSLIAAQMYCTYMVADANGSYPSEWSSLEAKTNDNAAGAKEDGVLNLKWSGEWKWTAFSKSSDVSTLGYEDGNWAEKSKSVGYYFGDNNTMWGKSSGVVYTKSATLSDTLTLPEGVSLPEDYQVNLAAGGVYTADGKIIYSVYRQYSYLTLTSLTVGQDLRTISYTVEMENPDVTNTRWNPVSGLYPTLYNENLVVTKAEGKITNEATFTVSSVEYGDGATTSKKVGTFEANDSAEVTINAAGEMDMTKIVTSVKDKDGNASTEKNADGLYVIKGGYTVGYAIEVTNTSDFVRKTEVKDVLPLALELDYNNVQVMCSSSGLSWTKSYNQTSATERTAIFSLTIPANATVRIAYDCKVNTSRLASSTSAVTITNVASMGDKTAEASISTPEPGTITYSKEVVSRYTTSPTGSPLYIWKNDQGQLAWSGDGSYLISLLNNSSSSIPSANIPYNKGTSYYEMLDTLLHQMNAGDAIEYLTVIDNASGNSITSGYIQDFHPYVYDAYSTVSGWRYYSMTADGSAYYMGKKSTNYTASRYNGSAYSSSDCGLASAADVAKAYRNSAKKLYSYHDLNDLNTPAYSSPSAPLQWNLSTYGGLNAYTTYKQTTILVVPGDNTIASSCFSGTTYTGTNSTTGNYDFQSLVSVYGMNYRSTSHKDPKSLLLISSAYVSGQTSEEYYSVAPQRAVNTGVLAVGTLSDPNSDNIKDGDMGNTYQSKDMTEYKTSSSSYVVNYVYVYNDSDTELDLSRVKLKLYIPSNFKFLGFVKTYSTGQYSESFTKPKNYIYESEYLSSDSKTGSAITTINYRANSTYPASGSYGQYSYDTLYANKSISFSYSGTTTTVDAQCYSPDINVSGSLNPYSGCYLMYACQGTDLSNSANNAYYYGGYQCTFSAQLECMSGISPQLDPCIYASEYWAAASWANYRPANRGICNSYLDGNKTFYTSHNIVTDNSQGNDLYSPGPTNQSVNRGGYYPATVLWSHVSLHTVKDQISVSVSKEAVSNSGYDSTTTLPDHYGDGESPYDDYYWRYILHDGLHRTVDGTVTWKTTVSNTGTSITKATGSNHTDVLNGLVNCSTLVETVDSPYTLREIYIPYLQIVPMQDGEVFELAGAFTTTNLYIELPESDDAWTPAADGSLVYEELLNKVATQCGSDSRFPMTFIRVTKRTVENGSLGWGYDVDDPAGDKNTSATQYLIEFSSSKQTFVKPGYWAVVLPTKDKTSYSAGSTTYNLRNSLDFYFTFATNDAIETNYNSFSLYLGDQQARDTTVTEGVFRAASDSHKTNAKAEGIVETPVGGGASTDGGTSSLASVVPDFPSGSSTSSYVFPDGTAAKFNSSTGKCEDVVAGTLGSGNIVEYSDWTDTSYTDGVKTITLLDESGDPTDTTVNTRSHGNMKLPKNANVGDSIHVQLTQENVLNESENYSYYDSLKIYDVWGVEEGHTGAGNNAYDVDFDSIEVTYAPGASTSQAEKTKLEMGKDYEVYYTTNNLVVYEHHPIKPVNTLQYAADLANLEGATTEWVLYDPENPPADDVVVAGIKVKILETSAYYKRMNNKIAQSDPTQKDVVDTIFVDFDTTVSDRAEKGGTYPNIEAWGATIQVNNSAERKPFLEDTTAALVEVNKSSKYTLKKNLVDGNDNPVASDEEFSFLIFGGGSTSSIITDVSDITDIAYVTVKAGDTVNLDDATIIYQKDPDTKLMKSRMSIIEVDSDVATLKSFGYSGTPNYFGVRTANLTYHFDNEQIQAIRTVFPEFADYITEGQTNSINRSAIYFQASAPQQIEFTAKNDAEKSMVSLAKTDAEGNTIFNEVSFKLTDSEGNAVKLGKDADGYFYTTDTAKATEESIAFNGTTSVRELPYGTYTLSEVSAPNGYKACEDKPIEVGAGRTDVVIPNEADDNPVAATIHVNKVDSKTGQAIAGSNATFQVYASNEEGSEPLHFVPSTEGESVVAGAYDYAETLTGVETVTSLETSQGALNLELMPEGDYYLVETDAPEGYALAGNTLDTATKVTVKRGNTDNITATIENEFVAADLLITKIDADTKNPITGSNITATFQLKTKGEEGTALSFTKVADGEYAYSQQGSVVDLQTSSRTGTLKLTNLPKGEFSLVETVAPQGYAIDQAQTTIEVADNTVQEVTVSDTVAPAALRVVKSWKLEKGNRTYPLSGVAFTAYQIQLNDEGKATQAVEYQSGTTDADGVLTMSDVDWSYDYLLVETVPEGYSTSGTTTVYKNEATGVIDLTQESLAEGFVAVEAIQVKMASDQGSLTVGDDGVWTCVSNVLNVKNVTYGGLFASVSYKTIDNAKSSEKYGADLLPQEKGYSYFYTDADYADGNYNYVHAVQADDVVTYTLNVANVSDYPFRNVVLVDRLPEQGDTGVVNLNEERDSKFTVYDPSEISVAVDGKTVDPALYKVTYSDKIKFTQGDFNNTTEWASEAAADTKSLRIAFVDDFELLPGEQVTVTFDAAIGEDATPDGSIAWNNFAYRYTAGGEGNVSNMSSDGNSLVTESTLADTDSQTKASSSAAHEATLTPEPPKVGVMIVDFESTIEGSKTFEAKGEQEKATSDFNFKLTFVSADNDCTIDNVSVVGADGKKSAFTADGLTATTARVANDGTAVDFAFDKLSFDRFGAYTFKVTEVIPEGATDNGDGTYSVGPITYNQVEYTVTVDCTNAISQDETHVVEPSYEAKGETADKAAYTNTYDNKTSVEGAKTWVDNDNADGDRPDEIVVGLFRNGKQTDSAKVSVGADGTWTYKFDGLAKFDENGKEYVYTVAEVDVPKGYTAEVEGTDIINTAFEKFIIEGSKTFEATGEQEKATSDFNFKLTFVSADNDATIANVSVVNADGKKSAFPTAGLTTTASSVANDGTPVDFAFDKLAVDRFGTYTFKVTEVIPEGATDNGDGTYSVGPITYKQVEYTVTVECTKAASKGEMHAVKVSYEANGETADKAAYTNAYDNKTSVEGTKTWDDEDNVDKLRPDYITVDLLRNGEKFDSVEVRADADGKWTFSFNDLAKFDENGKEYVYTVAESDVPKGYTVEVNGTDIVNTHTPEKPNTPDNPSKPGNSGGSTASTGDTVGIAVAGLLALAIVSAAALFFIRRRKTE